MDEANVIRVGDLVRWDAGGVIKVGVVSSINPDGTCTMTLQGKNGENVTMRIRSERLDKIVSTVEAQTARGDAEADDEEAEESSEDVEVTEIDETILTPEGVEERTTIVEEVLPSAPRRLARKAVAKAPPAQKAQVPKARTAKKAPAKKAKAKKAPAPRARTAKKAKAKKTVKAKVRAKKSGRRKK